MKKSHAAWTLLASLFLVVLVAQSHVRNSGPSPASPATGSLSLTSGPLSWDGFPGPAASPNETTCLDGANCDTFTVKLAPGDYTGKRARFKVTWTNQNNDYDVFVHAGSNAGSQVSSSTGGIPEVKEESTWDINAVVVAGLNDTYTIHTVYFAVGAGDPYHGVVSLENIPPVSTRMPNYSPGSKIGLTFSRSRTLYAHGSQADGEPNARIDFQGNAYAGGIRGVPGGDDLWRFDLNPNSSTYDPFLRAATPKIDANGNTINPAWKGQPDALSPLPNQQAGGDGGGDMDFAVGFKPATGAPPGAPPTLALTSLVLANISAQKSTDRGDSYMRDPAGQTSVVVDDRNWMEFYGGDSVYLAYREFAGLQLTSKFYVNRSDDGGFSYGPAVLAAVGGNTTGDVDVDQRDGTVYFCFQGPDTPGNSQVLVAVGHPPVAGLPPTEANYTTYVAATGQTSTIAALFPVCKVAPDGTVYTAFSDGGTAIYMAHSLDQGKTWSQTVRVSNLANPSTSIMPWLTTGKLPGAVALAWYGVEGADSDDGLAANNDKANWKVFFAESLNATAQNPTFYQTVASDHYIHGANISLGGFGGAANRNLLDFFQLATDPQGMSFIVFDDDSNDFRGYPYVMHQLGGLSLHTGKRVTVSGTDRVPRFDPSAPQVFDERHDARTFEGAIAQVPDVDSPADILTIRYGCELSNNKTLLTGVMRLSGLSSVPPDGTWRINFASNPTRPGVSDHADQWYLQATTDPTMTPSGTPASPAFTYGTATRNFDGSLSYTEVGTADFGAIDTSSGSVTLKVDIAKLNALQTHGLITDGTSFIGLRGSASVAQVVAMNRGVTFSDVTRGGTHYRLSTSSCVGANKPGDADEGQGEDSDRSDRDDFEFHESQQSPQDDSMQYNDRSRGMTVQSINAFRAISYNGSCVSFIGDALVNGQSGYQFTFAACDLSATGTGIGTFSISLTGPAGFAYQKSAAITSGYVSIHPH